MSRDNIHQINQVSHRILPVARRQVDINHQSTKTALDHTNDVLSRRVVTFVNLILWHHLAVVSLQHSHKIRITSELPRLIQVQLRHQLMIVTLEIRMLPNHSDELLRCFQRLVSRRKINRQYNLGDLVIEDVRIPAALYRIHLHSHRVHMPFISSPGIL